MHRTYITLSKAGHYTVTIRKDRQPVFSKRLISSLETARQIAAEFLATANQQEPTA
jgi:hypothetical protein